jgi:uncharacterized protein with GYD domain
MFGSYSHETISKVSRDRTLEVLDIVKKFGGKVKGIYAVMGAYNLVLIVDFKDMSEAMKTSIEVTKATGISFSTMPAIPIEEFDKLVGNK